MADLRDLILEGLDDEAVLWDGCDAALIGTSGGVAVYSYDALVRCFEEEGEATEDAMEWVDYNIVGAYVGPHTPLIVWLVEQDEATP